ncbi:MAG: peptidase, partial [Desulfurococcaceae archaeon]
MSKLNQLVEQYKRVPLVGMGRDLLRKITNYHRIQGSMELENAIREINNIFMEKGFETRLFEIPTSIIKGFMEIPASWNV